MSPTAVMGLVEALVHDCFSLRDLSTAALLRNSDLGLKIIVELLGLVVVVDCCWKRRMLSSRNCSAVDRWCLSADKNRLTAPFAISLNLGSDFLLLRFLAGSSAFVFSDSVAISGL